MGTQSNHLLLLGFLYSAVVLLTTASCQPLEVVILTETNFEHQTQAASGQTTGHWCVLFINSSLAEGSWQVAAEDAWHSMAADADKAAVMAKVDVAANSRLAKRFHLSSTPAVLLFRDRGMYTLSLAGVRSPDAGKVAAAVTAFVEGGYEQQAAEAVPGPPTLLDAAKEAAQRYIVVSPNPLLVAGIISLVCGSVLFIGFMGLGIWYSLPDKAPRQQPAATAAGARKTAAAAEAKAAGAAAAAAGDADDAARAGGAGDDDAEVVKPAASRATRRRA